VLEQLSGSEKKAEHAAKLADQLAAELAAHEQKLDPKSSGSTIAAAIIHFYRGESQRAAGQYADALASYETVLAAYPYNAWPDAAACQAAECYLALGDAETALQKFQEVANSQSKEPASARWRKLAQQRMSDLKKRK
jgi:tetratricopeptide (TPR) repeat protein